MREPYIRRNRVAVYLGDVREVLAEMPAGSVSCVITSPPYLGLRSYGTDPQTWGGDPECCHSWEIGTKPGQSGGTASAKVQIKGEANFQIVPDSQHSTCSKCGAWRGELGLEPTPELFVSHLVDVFREVRRVLHPSGVMWVNLGDSYAANRPGGQPTPTNARNKNGHYGVAAIPEGLKPKDLMMMPARVALALQADGWWLRSQIPWLKRSAMPESTTDRPTSAVEYVYLLSKSARYFYDGEAVKVAGDPYVAKQPDGWDSGAGGHGSYHRNGREHGTTTDQVLSGRSRRNSDWFFESWQGLYTDDDGDPLALIVNPQGFAGAHFATFPEALVEPMVRAGTSERGCCPKCGAPWKRVVRVEQGIVNAGHKARGRIEQGLASLKTTLSSGTPGNVVTTGWAPSCRCDAGDPIPCVVLDPFSGSGTTLLVAQRLGRRALGIEIKQEYADISGRRLAQEVLPL